jgi:hypothetical protein
MGTIFVIAKHSSHLVRRTDGCFFGSYSKSAIFIASLFKANRLHNIPAEVKASQGCLVISP